MRTGENKCDIHDGAFRRGTDMLWSERAGAWLAAYGAFTALIGAT